MKINFNTILKNLDDENLKQSIYGDEVNQQGERIKKGEEDLTLGLLSRSALLDLSQEELKLTGVEKQDRFFLAEKIKKAEKEGNEIDLKSEDVTLLKKIIGEKYMPIVIGRAWEILDPKS